MTATTSSTALATIQPAFTDAERLALAGFLAGYRGLTRDAYTLDLRQFTGWCRARSLPLFSVRRADIETFARGLEANGRARATVTRRLCTIAGFYQYAVEEELLGHSPAAHVRRPRLDYESHATALDRNELGALLVAAGLGPPVEHALISLLALNGLRVSEATGADVEHLGLQRGHRTLVITARARWSPSRSPRVPPARSSWRSASARKVRCSSQRTGGGWTGTAPPGSSGVLPAAPGSPSTSVPIRCGTRSSPLPWTPGSRCGMCRRPHPTLIRAPRCAMTGHALALTGMPPTSSPRSSPEQPDSHPFDVPGRPQRPGRAKPRSAAAKIADLNLNRDREPPIGAAAEASRRSAMASRTG